MVSFKKAGPGCGGEEKEIYPTLLRVLYILYFSLRVKFKDLTKKTGPSRGGEEEAKYSVLKTFPNSLYLHSCILFGCLYFFRNFLQYLILDAFYACNISISQPFSAFLPFFTFP